MRSLNVYNIANTLPLRCKGEMSDLPSERCTNEGSMESHWPSDNIAIDSTDLASGLAPECDERAYRSVPPTRERQRREAKRRRYLDGEAGSVWFGYCVVHIMRTVYLTVG